MNFRNENNRIAKLINDGLAKLALEEAGDALLDFESALFFDSENLVANCLAALCLSRLERSVEAEVLALKGVALAPDSAMPHLVAAEVLAAAQKLDEALFHVLDAVALEPYNAGLRIELARFLILAGRPEEACVPLRSALEISPKRDDARLLLALALTQQKRWTEAETEIEVLGQLEKVDARWLALAGWLRFSRAHDLNSSEPKLEEYKQAAALLTRANQIDPSIELARQLLALSNEAVERVGKPADAEFPRPNRLRQALIVVAVVVYVVSFGGGFLWLANRDFSTAILAGLGLLAFYVVLLVLAGLMRRDLSFLPPGLFMFINRATKGWLTRWSNPVVTQLFGAGDQLLRQSTASQAEDGVS